MIGIIVTEGGELAMQRGRLALGEVRSQNIELLLRCNKGELKQLPIFGGEVMRMLGSSMKLADIAMWKADIKKQLKAANLEVGDIRIDGENIIIEQ